MHEVWITGVGMTRIGRRAESLPALMAEAAHAALSDAGLERPDALVIAVMNPEEFVGDGNFASHVATYLGLSDVPAIRIETATSSGAAAFYTGFAEVAAGLARHVLVVGRTARQMQEELSPVVQEISAQGSRASDRAARLGPRR